MSTRLRLFVIFLGALLVVATYTFPYWQPLLSREDAETTGGVFDALAPQLRPTFEALPPDQRAAYQTLADENPQVALEMAGAAISLPTTVPDDQGALPSMTGPVVVAEGAFAGLDALRQATGEVTIFQQVDDSKIVRFENFSVTNAPDLRVVMSANPAPQTLQDMELNGLDLDLGALQGNIGSQNYAMPPEADITQYNSVVLFSRSLNLIYGVARLRQTAR